MLKFIIATDFSATSTLALNAAKEWSVPLKASLELVHVNEMSPQLSKFPISMHNAPAGIADIRHWVEQGLQEKMREQISASVCPLQEIKMAIPEGRPEEELAKLAGQCEEALLFLGGQRHPFIERLFQGPLSEKLVAISPVPLVLIRRKTSVPKQILLATDFSAEANKLIPWAMRLAQATGAHCHLIHLVSTHMREYSYDFPFDAVSTRFIQDLLEKEKKDADIEMARLLDRCRSQCSQVSGEVHVLSGQLSTAEGLVSYASKRAPDLLMVAAHGRSGIDKLLMGSVAQHIVRRYDGNIFLHRAFRR